MEECNSVLKYNFDRFQKQLSVLANGWFITPTYYDDDYDKILHMNENGKVELINSELIERGLETLRGKMIFNNKDLLICQFSHHYQMIFSGNHKQGKI